MLLLAAVLLGPARRRGTRRSPGGADAATAPAGVRPALARDETALADPVREALRTLPQAKKKFLAGLPSGDQFLLSVRVIATDTSFRQASARVLGWHGNTVQALLLPEAADSEPPSTGRAPARELSRNGRAGLDAAAGQRPRRRQLRGPLHRHRPPAGRHAPAQLVRATGDYDRRNE